MNQPSKGNKPFLKSLFVDMMSYGMGLMLAGLLIYTGMH